MQKRDMTLTKDEYFIALLNVEKELSEDPSTQMSAAIEKNGKLISLGHNHSPKGFIDMPWNRTSEDPLESKYLYVVHAERDAIANAANMGIDIKGATMYVLNFPCNECAIEIVNFGIVEVVYVTDNYKDADFTKAAKVILEKAGVKCRQYLNLENISELEDH